MIKFRVYRGKEMVADFFTNEEAENFIDLDSKKDNYELLGKNTIKYTIKVYIYINNNSHLRGYTIQPFKTEERGTDDV